jgi:hypothetical protein
MAGFWMMWGLYPMIASIFDMAVPKFIFILLLWAILIGLATAIVKFVWGSVLNAPAAGKRLRKLDELRASGLLTPEEYQSQREKIISQL